MYWYILYFNPFYHHKLSSTWRCGTWGLYVIHFQKLSGNLLRFSRASHASYTFAESFIHRLGKAESVYEAALYFQEGYGLLGFIQVEKSEEAAVSLWQGTYVIGKMDSALECGTRTWCWNVQLDFPLECGTKKRGDDETAVQCLIQDRIQDKGYLFIQLLH